MKRHTEDGSSGSNASWVSTGAPLFLGEAAFLKRALHGQRIGCRIDEDLRLDSRRDAVHSVLVIEGNLAGAVAVRNEVLGRGEEIDVNEVEKKDGERKRFAKALGAGFLGMLSVGVLGLPLVWFHLIEQIKTLKLY